MCKKLDICSNGRSMQVNIVHTCKGGKKSEVNDEK